MKIKDVWYFNCKQGKEEFLQPDFFQYKLTYRNIL